MKKQLIGLLLLSSFSAFSSEYNVKFHSEKIIQVSSRSISWSKGSSYGTDDINFRMGVRSYKGDISEIEMSCLSGERGWISVNSMKTKLNFNNCIEVSSWISKIQQLNIYNTPGFRRSRISLVILLDDEGKVTHINPSR